MTIEQEEAHWAQIKEECKPLTKGFDLDIANSVGKELSYTNPNAKKPRKRITNYAPARYELRGRVQGMNATYC